MTSPKVTILIPSYKTPVLTKLCLRLIRKNTDQSLANVIVIDNDSQDESLDYLKSLSWIQLIERKRPEKESPPIAHSRALDLGLSVVQTPYVLSIHTDTLVRNKNWLPYLIAQIEKRPAIAGVGSWKLEQHSLHKKILKSVEKHFQLAYCAFTKKQHAIEGLGSNHYYLRSHCAMYRTDLIKKHALHFSDHFETAGKSMHRDLIANGYEMLFLESKHLLKYIDHINHATMILNPSLSERPKSIQKGMKRIQKSLESFQATEILSNNTLDT